MAGWDHMASPFGGMTQANNETMARRPRSIFFVSNERVSSIKDRRVEDYRVAGQLLGALRCVARSSEQVLVQSPKPEAVLEPIVAGWQPFNGWRLALSKSKILRSPNPANLVTYV